MQVNSRNCSGPGARRQSIRKMGAAGSVHPSLDATTQGPTSDVPEAAVPDDDPWCLACLAHRRGDETDLELVEVGAVACIGDIDAPSNSIPYILSFDCIGSIPSLAPLAPRLMDPSSTRL